MSTAVVRTIPSDHLSPVRAYAALRAQAPDRASFLFESATPGGPWGRYAILGYRARGDVLYSRKADLFEMIGRDIAELGEAPESLAAGLTGALVGFVAYEAVHKIHEVEPWPDELVLGRVMRDTTVAVFDQVAQTVTIAGASLDAVRRCAWEMTRGPELVPLPLPDASALPEWLDVTPTDDKHAAKEEEARQRLSAGEVSELVMARRFHAPLRGADPFDAYRALRLLSPSAHLFFLDFAEAPFAPGLTLVGASSETLIRRDMGAPPAADAAARSPLAEMRDAFLAAAPVGKPRDRAAQLIRELEPVSRSLYGGAVGYLLPGGGMELAVSRSTLVVRQGYFEVISGAPVGAASTAAAQAEATLQGARPALAAVCVAYRAAELRESIAKHRAEAERVAAEKAAADKAEAERAAEEQAPAELTEAERAAAEQAVAERAAAEEPAVRPGSEAPEADRRA